ncbi:MAG: hypothetical protein ACYC2T_01460 [Bacillota bacterium]
MVNDSSHPYYRGKVRAGGSDFNYRIEDGEIRIRLPFPVDLNLLAQFLSSSGYYTSADDGADLTGSLGWGVFEDREDYYPYWVYSDLSQPGTSIFAYPPEDYAITGNRGDPTHIPMFGPEALEELEHWLSVIWEHRIKH